jgi:glycosyltransferase involved in cell wall biosynthesis
MTCGTPVLATPVGAIPDIIIDGKTGFIMKDNSPECIAENVIRALSSPDLEKIVKNGRRFVDENFTFEKTVGIWRSILRD